MELVKNKKVDRVLETPDAANPLVVEINIDDVIKLLLPVSWPFRNTGPEKMVEPKFTKVDGPYTIKLFVQIVPVFTKLAVDIEFA